MKPIMKWFSPALLVLAFSCTATWAQGTAQISGTVKDQTGAVLPGVEVTATQTDTGVTRSTISNETGSFVLPNLVVGPYRLEAALGGFRTFVQNGIVLQLNSSPVVNPTLEVGQVAEQVEVQANAVMVETRSQGVGQIVENARILELPLNGRNAADLIVLAGGAVQTGTTGNRTFVGSPIVSVSGGMGFGTAYSLDGANLRDPYNGQSLPLPFPDALQEFKVETSGISASHGEGTSIGAVTKSGTNELHGNAFEFVRNDLFNARSYFASANSTLKRNQFGGTLGGPIKKNKLFFFVGYQGTTIRQDPADTRVFVPTAAILSGDWSAFTSTACNAGRQITLRAPFANNRVDPALYSKAALNIAGKLPKVSDSCGQITYALRSIENDGQVVGKVDYQWNDKHSVFGRYVGSYSHLPNPFNPDNLLTSPGRGYNNLAQSYTFGDTYLFSTSVVNAFRLAVNRGAVARKGAQFFSPSDIGINAYSYVSKYTVLQVTGGFNIGGGTSTPATFRTTSYQAGDDVSIVRGTHQWSFGANLAHGRSNGNSNSNSPGTYSFNGQETGLGMADFLLGKLTQLAQGGPSAQYMKQWYFAAYVQDAWKMTPRLTMNYGIRWEPWFPQVSTNKAVYAFDEGRFQQGIKSTVYKNAPSGLYFPGDPGFPGLTGINKRWGALGPRLGLAWDPQGDGRTSLRVSYGLSYNYLPLQWRIDASSAPPFGNRLSNPSPAGGLDNPWTGFPGGNPFPYTIDANVPFVPAGLYLVQPYDIRPTYASTWNLSLQRQLSADWLVSATYMGTETTHVWAQQAINPSLYIAGGPCTLNGVVYNPCSTTANTNQRRLLSLQRPQDGQYIGALDLFDDGGTQNYHGMLLSVQRRAAKGVTLSSNYTFSHCIGDNADVSGMGPGAGTGYTDPNNRRLDRGNCDADRRHIFNMTAVAETPRFANNTLRMIGTGWRLSGIYRKSSGAFLTVTSGVDRALTGIGAQRPDQVLADPYLNKSADPLTSYLNAAAFALPTLGRNGNMGRGNVQGPGTWQFDTSLSRVFAIRESQKLEFRAEAYNLTNSFRPGNPNAALNSNTFGQIRTSLDPRILQFALKYVF